MRATFGGFGAWWRFHGDAQQHQQQHLGEYNLISEHKWDRNHPVRFECLPFHFQPTAPFVGARTLGRLCDIGTLATVTLQTGPSSVTSRRDECHSIYGIKLR